MRLSRNIVGTAFLVVAVSACSGTDGRSGPDASQPGLRVVATTTVFADIVRAIGGADVTVSSIIPAGVGPEDYEPRPSDAASLTDANLIVSNGLGLDGFLDRLIASGTAGSVPRLVLGEGVSTIDVDGLPNPHVWLDPTIVRGHFVPAIVAQLSSLDPSHASAYASSGATYQRDLDALDNELAAKLSVIPADARKLVTTHDAFPYFARHYGFEVVGVIVPTVGQEPTAADLAALIDKVKATGVKAIFSEAQFSPKLATTLAQEAGITSIVTTLYNDALGPPPADTYLGMMRWNVDQIVKALS
jgi:zinc/manganese transport system substrate-binding protein/manganese/iron transport system substrate-binding protein